MSDLNSNANNPIVTNGHAADVTSGEDRKRPFTDSQENYEADGDAAVNEASKNVKSVICQFCGSKVLSPDVAKLRRGASRFLPAMNQKTPPSATATADMDGETLDDFWLLDDMFQFENVGFSNPVNNVKYLTCADCEMGPIGFHDTTKPKEFYVALKRVKHV